MPPKPISPSDAQLLLEGLHHVTGTVTIYLPDLATQKSMKTHALAERFRIMAKRYGLNLRTTTVGTGGSPVIRRPATQRGGRVKKEDEEEERGRAEPMERAPRRGAGKRKYAEEEEEEDEEEGLQEMKGKGMQGSERKERAGRKTVEGDSGSDDIWGEDGGRAMTDSDVE